MKKFNIESLLLVNYFESLIVINLFEINKINSLSKRLNKAKLSSNANYESLHRLCNKSCFKVCSASTAEVIHLIQSANPKQLRFLFDLVCLVLVSSKGDGNLFQTFIFSSKTLN